MTTDGLLESIQNMKSLEIIQQHPYKIWQGKDSRWRTYLPDFCHKDGRRLIAKSTRLKLDKAIVDDYRRRSEIGSMALMDFYPEWFDYKESITSSQSTMRRYEQYWKKYYCDSTIVTLPFAQLDVLKLTTWAHNTIKKHRLSAKEFGNMKVIINGCLKLAVQKGILASNPWLSVDINPKFFRVIHKKTNVSQVYLDTELPLLYNEILLDLKKHPERTDGLAILFNLQLGLRVGELVALKWIDIEDDYIHIQRMESRLEHRLADGTWGPTTYEVVEHTKTFEKGERLLYLTDDARQILNVVREVNKKYAYDDEFVFCDSDGRTKSRCISDKLERYCNHLNIPVKSTHKLRKTVASLLNASGVPLDEIRRILGHTDEKTTLKYIFNPFHAAETECRINNALTLSSGILESVTKCNQVQEKEKSPETA